MAENCSIRILLDAEHSAENIFILLEAGKRQHFKYYDHIWGELYRDAPLITPIEATKKVIRDETDEGPSVLTVMQDSEDVTLWFYKTEYNQLKFHVGTFSIDCKQKEYRVDLGYYIPLFLGLCNNFPILHVSAEFFGD